MSNDQVNQDEKKLKEREGGMSSAKKTGICVTVVVVALIAILLNFKMILGWTVVAAAGYLLFEFTFYKELVVDKYIKKFTAPEIGLPDEMTTDEAYQLIKNRLDYPYQKMAIESKDQEEDILVVEGRKKGCEVEIKGMENEQGDRMLCISPRLNSKTSPASYPYAKIIANEVSVIINNSEINIDRKAEEKRVKRWALDFKVLQIGKPIEFAVVIISIVLLCTLYFGYKFKYVYMVKEGSPVAYSGITYGEAFDNFFEDPKWEGFTSDTNQHIVEFTGKCLYQNTEVEVTMQFTIDYDESNFEVTYCGMNEVPQNMLVTYALISNAFESY